MLRHRNLLAARRALRSKRGMTLVEVMVVIAIIVTLMSIVGYGVYSLYADSQVETTTLQMHEVNKRIELYALKKGFPSTSEGLKAVYKNEDPPKDSWGRDFVYVSPGPNGLDYDLVSYGADGQEGGSGNDADIKWSEIR